MLVYVVLVFKSATRILQNGLIRKKTSNNKINLWFNFSVNSHNVRVARPSNPQAQNNPIWQSKVVVLQARHSFFLN